MSSQIPEWAIVAGWSESEWAAFMEECESELAHHWLDWTVEAYEEWEDTVE